MARNAAARAGRPPLTRESIVRAAVTLIERDGAEALTMRRVAAELGVGTMSLYNHVPDRDALLADMARTVLSGLDLPEGEAGEDWKASARAMIGAFRGAARAYPRSMYLVLTSRLDLEFSWRAAERALELLAAAGFDGETSVRVLRALMSYAIGSQMMENGALRTPDQTPESAFQSVQDDPGSFPHVIAMAPHLMRIDPEADFEIGLEMLLSALDRLPRSRA